MTYKAIDIANEFVRLGIEHNKPLTQISILKLIYISHGLVWAIKNEKLIEEDFYAWKFGPVIPELYKYTKVYGNAPINNELFGAKELDNEMKSLIKDIYEAFGNEEPFKLVKATHRKNGAWDKTTPYCVIKDSDIKEEFFDLEKHL